MQYYRVQDLREFVTLLQKQVEALELETYVGLTDEEQREYHERQERIRGLEALLDPATPGPPPPGMTASADQHHESHR